MLIPLAAIVLAIIVSFFFFLACLTLPIEVLILFEVVNSLLAGASIPGLDTSVLFYLRFLPSVMLLIRGARFLFANRIPRFIFPKRILVPFGMLSLFALASSSYSTDSGLTFQRAISMVFVLGGMGTTIPVYVGTPTKMERLIKWVGIVTCLLILAGILLPHSYIVQDFNPLLQDYGRSSGIFANPNTLGVVAMFSTFAILIAIFKTRTMFRLFLFGLMVTSVTGILQSGSRGSALGLIFGVVFYLSLRTKFTVRIALLFLAIPIVILIILPSENLDIASVANAQGSGRFQIWEYYIEYARDSPIVGKGFGAGDEDYLLFLSRRRLDPTLQTHNSYLRLFVDLGAIGAVFAGVGFIYLFSGGIRLATHSSGDKTPAWLAATVVAGMFNAAFEEWMFSFGSAAAQFFWLFVIIWGTYIAWSRAPQ